MSEKVCKSERKRANMRSHIVHPKKSRTDAHRTHILKCFSHAHRTRASVRVFLQLTVCTLKPKVKMMTKNIAS